MPSNSDTSGYATVRDVLEALEELVDQHGHHVMDLPVAIEASLRQPVLRPRENVVEIPRYRRPRYWTAA